MKFIFFSIFVLRLRIYVVAINVVFMRNVDSYCVRVSSLNVGTGTGKGRSFVDMMETRKVGLVCV